MPKDETRIAAAVRVRSAACKETEERSTKTARIEAKKWAAGVQTTGGLKPTHSQVERRVEESVAAEVGRTRTEHNAHVKRAIAAAGTAGVEVSAADCTDMHNSRMRLVGTRVECALMVQPGDRLQVFTRGTDGESQWKGRSGEWRQQRVERVEWRDDAGGPEAMLVGQGKQSWHHLVNLGAVAKRKTGCVQSECDRVYEQALQWMGQGATVEVEWPVQQGSRMIGECTPN